MILFNIKKLEQELSNRNISDKKALWYLIFTSLLFSLKSYVPNEIIETNETNLLTLLEIAISAIITIWACLKTFEINSKGDNQDFFKRFISLSFVVTIRVLVFLFLLLIPIPILIDVFRYFYGINTFIQDHYALFLTPLILTCYYLLLILSFKRINQQVLNPKSIE
jgi:hypothetical protein